MTAYVYRLLSPKYSAPIVVDGVAHRAAIAVYAYKPSFSWSGQKMNLKMDTLVENWTRCWDGIEIPKYIVIHSCLKGMPKKTTSFVGCTVIESRNKRSFYDDPDWEKQPWMGMVHPDGTVSKETITLHETINSIDYVPIFAEPEPGEPPVCHDCRELYTEGMFCEKHRIEVNS